MGAPVSRDEFVTYMELLKEKIDDGFSGVHRRQDTTNGRIDKAEGRLLVLERVRPEDPPATPPPARLTLPPVTEMKARLLAAATIGAGVIGAVIKLVEALK